MKKSILFVAGAALVLASCSKDEVTSINTGDAIAFRTAMGTRATEMTTTDLESFKVTALTEAGDSYFDNVEFTGTTPGSFNSATPYYWPAGNLKFYAYSPSDLGITAGTITGTSKTYEFTANATIADQVDFITAYATGNKDNNASGVALTFEHQLARVSVKAYNTNSNYTYEIAGVRLGRIDSKGTFTFADASDGSWSNPNTPVKYTAEFAGMSISDSADSPTTILGDGTDSGSAMVVPQQLTAWTPDSDNGGSYISVKLKVTMTGTNTQIYPSTGDYGWAAVAVGENWEAGNHYTYTLNYSTGAGNVDPDGPDGDEETDEPDDPFQPGDDIFGQPISFTVTVNPWTDVEQDKDM